MDGNVLKEMLVSLGFKTDEKSMSKFLGNIKVATKRIAVFAGAVKAASAAIYAGVTKIAADQSALLELAENAGVTISALNELGYAAAQSGASIEQANSTVSAFAKTVTDAAMGKGAGLETFARLGISVKDTAGKVRDTMGVFDELRGKLRGLSKDQQLYHLNTLGMDKTMLKTMTTDISSITAEYRQLQKVAGVTDDAIAQQSRGFVKNINKVKAIIMKLSQVISFDFMTKTKNQFETFRKFLLDNFKKIRDAAETFINVIMRVSGFITTLALRIGGWISKGLDWFNALDAGTQKIIKGIGLLLIAWKLFNAGFLATPLGLVIGAFIALLALIDDYMVWKEGGKSLIDWSPWAKQIEEIIALIKPLIQNLGKLLKIIGQAFVAAFKKILPNIKIVFTTLLDLIKGIVAFISAIFEGDFSKIVSTGKALFRSLGKFIESFFSMAVIFIRELFSSLWTKLEQTFPDFAAAIADVKDKIAAGFEWIVGYVMQVWEGLKTYFKGFVTFLDGIFKGNWGKIKEGFLTMLDGLIQIVSKPFQIMADIILGIFDWLWDSIADRFPDFAGTIKKGLGAIGDFFGFDTAGEDSADGKPAGGSPPPPAALHPPAPVVAAAVSNTATSHNNQNNNVEVTNNITISGAGDPKQTAALVASKQRETYGDAIRNTQGGIR